MSTLFRFDKKGHKVTLEKEICRVRLHFATPNRVMYKNWKGEIRMRIITPVYVWWGKTEFHPEEQWLLRATDEEKGEVRDFALKDMEPYVSDYSKVQSDSE